MAGKTEVEEGIKNSALQIQPDLVEIRRDFHRHPELSGKEVETARRLERILKDLGLSVQTGIAGCGLVATVEGELPGRTALVRADIDALPIVEQSGVDFTSQHEGVMHACGHDIHMTVAIGAARLLQDRRKNLKGKVKFLFQPSEEVPPGGALPMIESGVLDNPDVDAAFALHVYPGIPVGSIGVRDGVLFSQADDFDVEILGKGGHGAMPHQGNDAIAAACEFVSALQNARSRRVDPVEPSVISIGRIEGGTQRNVLCPRVTIEGTARAANPEIAALYPKLINDVAAGVASAFGVEINVKYETGYPPVNNHTDINDFVRRASLSQCGDGKVVTIKDPMLAGEDFAYFTRRVPSAMFLLGIGNPDIEAVYPWHHPKFRADERALAIGAGIFAAAVSDFCGHDK